jgi:hypothetical protein
MGLETFEIVLEFVTMESFEFLDHGVPLFIRENLRGLRRFHEGVELKTCSSANRGKISRELPH